MTTFNIVMVCIYVAGLLIIPFLYGLLFGENIFDPCKDSSVAKIICTVIWPVLACILIVIFAFCLVAAAFGAMLWIPSCVGKRISEFFSKEECD